MLPRLSQRFTLKTLILAFVVALSGVHVPTSHAIPIAGNYQFTGGLTGNFTSNGSALTAWSITVPSTAILWSDLEPSMNEPRNDALGFRTETQVGFVEINWSANSFAAQIGNPAFGGLNVDGSIRYQQSTNVAVPEPRGVTFLVLGLLLIMGYGLRRRTVTPLRKADYA